ncbi:DMT family transporter [Agrobacterium rosae]|uniref:DMT family transporter n=1 Tax=Agrobacterium rosae TaxID=1972867 RepID=A0AAE5RYG6_9HYPH|nr:MULTISPECIES: DMT family transporter [Agrobacterium]MCM2433591.1 DMT family transporter [Agrobacterium rosae]MDX8315691.1 DMT family transporter [Agrobacterium rosae]MDX8329855.1 DMT family transporter [Agrobacterium rosae]POO51693.1 EamA/RhaT family transporter [Agrobacterium rosae]SCX25258.1 EamA-like transporter family protein [Agrobacterium sp. DSM 25558]
MSAAAYNPIRGISFKLISVAFFLVMQTCIKAAGPDVPAGEITFFRSTFAIVPIVIYLAWLRSLSSAFYTKNLAGHFKRGFLGIVSMICGFYGLSLLPLPEFIAIGYASPLMAVVFAAVLLGETVRVYRWSAVLVGMTGVVVILWPKLTLLQAGGFAAGEGIGALAVLLGAVLGGLAMVQVRQLVVTEKTATIVLYFSLTGSLLSALSLPFDWEWLDMKQTILLMSCGIAGGIAQIFLTESYRHAEVSTIAPFEYSSILFGITVSYVLFGDIPTMTMLIGTGIVISAGIFIIFREHQLGLARKAARKASTPQG